MIRSQAQKTRLKEVLEAIEARKKMIKEIGYGNGDDKRLEEKLKVARTRLAELQAKSGRIEDLERQLKVAQERNADLKDLNGKSDVGEGWQSKSKPKRRLSRR